VSQAPIKVNEQTKERIRYLAALTDATQAQIVDRAVSEYAARHVDEIAAGMERARSVLTSGEAAVAAYLLDEPVEAVERIADKQAVSAKP
jgi:predicted transcriptional regulator